jgi:hypothetical protein
MKQRQLSDPVLAFHRVHPRIFEVSFLRTGSVRDQMSRAALLVERLERQGHFKERRRLLVVGAGAAGVSAAWRASQLGVSSVLLEQADSSFRTQQPVTSRTLDPTEYDWPHRHWRRGCLPMRPDDPPLPLSYARGRAADLAFQWQRDFDQWVHTAVPSSAGRYAPIDVRHQRRIADPLYMGPFAGMAPYDRRKLGTADEWDNVGALTWTEDGIVLDHLHDRPESFDLILSCIGFGREDVQIVSPDKAHTYTGPLFWAADKIEEKDMGLPATGARVDVLISGGGDGAQQDIQRLLTRKCGRDLYDAISTIDGQFNQRIRRERLLQADDLGRRAHAWRDPTRPPVKALQRWHREYHHAAETVWHGWPEALRQQLIDKVLRESIAMKLVWVVGGPAPSFSFGLNRLLTHLVLRLHAHHYGRLLWTSDPKKILSDNPTVIAGFKLVKVIGNGHTCHPEQDCSKKPHRAYCLIDGNEKPIGDFDLVLIRHGMLGGPLFGEPPVPEQIVPLGLPD